MSNVPTPRPGGAGLPPHPTVPLRTHRSRNASAMASRMTSAFHINVGGYSAEEERHLVRLFMRKVLEAFASSSEFSTSRFNIAPDSDPENKWDAFFRAQRPDSEGTVLVERHLRQLFDLHSTCIEGVADQLANLLLPDDGLQGSNPRVRISAALSEDDKSFPGGPQTITIPDAFRALQVAASKFRTLITPSEKAREEGTAELWSPDWRTQIIVWGLIRKMGQVRPPPILQPPYQELKEAAFACLFERDFIDNQWLRCSFRANLLRYIPRPYNWDGDLSWIGVAFFVAMPLTGFMQQVYGGAAGDSRFLSVGVFWGIFFGIFFSTAVGVILFHSAYRSQYSTGLMQRAAVGTAYEDKFGGAPAPLLQRISSVPGNLADKLRNPESVPTASSDSLDAVDLASVASNGAPPPPSPVLPTVTPAPKASGAWRPRSPPTRQIGNPSSSAPALNPMPPMGPEPRVEPLAVPTARRYSVDGAYFDFSGHVPSRPNDELPTMAPDRAIGFEDDEPVSGLSGAALQLYQASMFVRRIYGSTYFDESWAFGLSEDQVRDAIKVMLTTDSSLGRQYAAFSFAAIAVASRGVPPVSSTVENPGAALGPAALAALREAELTQFNFGIFSFLGALSFISGITSAVLADMILRQMSFTQISREGTAHGFVVRFGFFIRVVGGLNSMAGMFLSTAVLHFLISIFKVSPYAVIGLGGTWLILGTMVSESFFSNYHFWRMSEILDDVTLISEPDVLSPSPLTGALQFVVKQLRKATFSKKRKRHRDRQ